MARIRVTFDGRTAANGSPLLMHNERLADPLDPYSKWVAEISKKRNKPEREIEELSRREFHGAGYWSIDAGPDKSGVGGPFIPTWNIIRCLQESAKRHKLGQQVLRGIVPIEEETPLVYEGPTTVAELWTAQTFHSRKGVGVGQKKVMRTRPCFTDWKVEAELELDLTILDPEQVNMIAFGAGRYVGLGDNRPRFGRFLGTAVLVGDSAEFTIPDVLDDERQRLAAETAQRAITQADEIHAEKNPNGPARKESVKRVLAGTKKK